MNRVRGRRIAYALGLIAFGILIAYVANQKDLISALGRISIGNLATIVLVSVVAALLQGWQFRSIAVVFGLELTAIEWFGLTITNTMVNYLVPARAGLAVRAAYLKKVHALPLGRYAAMTATLLLMSVAVAATLGLIGFATHASGSGATTMGLVFLATFAISVGLVLTVPYMMQWAPHLPQRLRHHIDAFREGLMQWRCDRFRGAAFLAITGLWMLAQTTRLWLIFRAVGSAVPFGVVLMIQALVGVAFVISITPGNLGVREGAIAFAAATLGIGSQLGLLVGLVDRAVSFGVTMTLGSVFVHPLATRSGLRQPVADGDK